MNRDFTTIKQAADSFVIWANNELDKIENTNIQISDRVPTTRLRKKT
jgi:hypothetical protein